MATQDDIKQAAEDSLANYANKLRGKGRREILNEDYEPPSDLRAEYESDAMKAAVDFWNDAMRQWRQKYGSLEGWHEFHNYWSFSGFNYIGLDKVSASDAFTSSKYQQIRDNFGYASKEELDSNRAETIAGWRR